MCTFGFILVRGQMNLLETNCRHLFEEYPDLMIAIGIILVQVPQVIARAIADYVIYFFK